MEKIVIVGANHAGLAATKYLLESDKKYEIILIDKNSSISYLGCGISLLIKQEVTDSNLFFYVDKKKLVSSVDCLYLETEVVNIDFANKSIFCKKKDGTNFIQKYDKLILATGSNQFVLDIPGKDLKYNFTVKNYIDAFQIAEALKETSVKKVGIIGAGYIGVELAEVISKLGKEVYLFDVADRVLSTYYDKTFSDNIEELLRNNGVRLCLNEGPEKYYGEQKIEKIVTNVNEYPIDMVIQSIGFFPNSSIGEKEIIRYLDGAYLTDQYQQTNVKDVYAIGDCATTFSLTINREVVVFSVSNAIRTGYVASQHIDDKKISPLGSQFPSGFSVFDNNFYSIGLNVKTANLMGESVNYVEAEEEIRPCFMAENNKVKLRIIYNKESRCIVGAQFSSQEELSGLLMMFALVIEEQVTIDKLKMLDYLFYPYFSQPYHFITKAITGMKTDIFKD